MMKTQNSSRQERHNAFWERMAQNYPLPFDDKVINGTRQVIALVKDKGVEFSNTRILDIGCGTGIYTLPLAGEAAMLTGIDDSRTMIERMETAMTSENIDNVHPIKASWKNIDITDLEFEKAFDIVWTSMTPAVQTARDFEQMERCARKWCVYIGWGRKRKNALMEEIFQMHGLKNGPPPGVGQAGKILADWGRTPSLDYFETSWSWTGTVEDALENMVCFVEMQGKEADRDRIRQVLDHHEQDGLVHHTTEVEEGVMVWQVA